MSVLLTEKSYFTLKIYYLLKPVTIKWYQLMNASGERRPTSRSRPGATVTMSPVSLLMVNMLGIGLCGVWDRIRQRTIPLAVVLSSASNADRCITYVPDEKQKICQHLCPHYVDICPYSLSINYQPLQWLIIAIFVNNLIDTW